MIGKIEKKMLEFNFANEGEKHFQREFNFADEGPIREIREIFFPRNFLTTKYYVFIIYEFDIYLLCIYFSRNLSTFLCNINVVFNTEIDLI